MDRQKSDLWREAIRRCGLSDEEVRMALELGFQPGSLIKNIPSPSQPWKRPVNEWVRSLYEQKFGARKPPAGRGAAPPPTSVPLGIERRNADDPWPDNPVMADLPPLELDFENPDDEFSRFERPEDDEIEEEQVLMLRQQRLFRWAAQAIAVALSELPEVEKVAAFGAVSQPLETEVPRFRKFRRYGIEILHECADLDLAVWLNDLSRLQAVKKAMARGLKLTQETPYGGVAHLQVDVHIFDFASSKYRGRLCIFKECPKPGKSECLVPGCGEQPFLQQFQGYRFKPGLFASEAKVVLFERSANFLVPLPRIEGKLRGITWRERPPDEFAEDDIRTGEE
jgi:hypothetical protein